MRYGTKVSKAKRLSLEIQGNWLKEASLQQALDGVNLEAMHPKVLLFSSRVVFFTRSYGILPVRLKGLNGDEVSFQSWYCTLN